MAEKGESRREKGLVSQDILGVLIASFEMRMLKNNPLFEQAKEFARRFAEMQFETRIEALAAANEMAEKLDQLAQSGQLLGLNAAMEAPEILLQEPEPASSDTEDILLRKRALREEESASAGTMALGGKFYGFIGRAAECEDDYGMYRPILSFQIIHGSLESTFAGIRLYATGEITDETNIHFERDEILEETREVLMTLSGKNAEGKDDKPALVDRAYLMNFSTLLNAAMASNYRVEVFAEMEKVIQHMTTGSNYADNKGEIDRCLEKLIVLGLNLGPRRFFSISCGRIVDKELAKKGEATDLQQDVTTTHGETALVGPVLGIDFMPVLAEGDGFIMASPEKFPHLVVEEHTSSNGQPVAEKERRLRYIPLQSITGFKLAAQTT